MFKHFGLRSKFLIVALAVYLIVGAAAAVALAGIVGHLTGRIGLAYAGKYALANSAVLREPLDRELTLARLMADSPAIKDWVRAETDEGKRAKAFAELEGYRQRFADTSWFLVSNATLHYYCDDQAGRYGVTKLAYTLAPDNAKDDWYFATLKNVTDFAVNVNYDNVLDAHKVWINVVIRDQDGTPLGLTGTGLDLSKFLRLTVDNAETGVENILLDQRLAIQAHHDRSMIDQHSVAKPSEKLSTVARLIGRPEDLEAMQAAFARLRNGSSAETFFVTIDGQRRIVGAAYVSSLQWYVLSILDMNQIIGKHLFLPMLGFGTFVLLVLAAVVVLVANRLILKPLSAITVSAQRISEGNHSLVLPPERGDEIGTLTRTFSQMSATIRDNTDNLERLVMERTAQLNESNQRLQEHMDQLKEALANVKTLEGILPICASCKKIRDDQGYWTQVEAYVSQRTSAQFSHGICPDCVKQLYPHLPKKK